MELKYTYVIIEDFEKNLMDIYEMVQAGTLEIARDYKGILRVAG